MSTIVPNEALYRSLIERVPGIVYISHFGSDAKWHYVSPHIKQYLGYAAEEWLADPSLWLQHVHPEDREMVLAEEQRLHKTGTAFFAEYRMVSKDGRVIWFRDESMIIRPEGFDVPVLYGILFDISERKAMEVALRESEERLRLALEAAHLGMWEWDPETDALFWDDRHCSLFGLNPKEAPATAAKFLELVFPEDREWVRHAVREGLRHDEAYGAEYRVRWPDGREHWLASAGRVLRNADSRAYRMRGITYDVTDRRGLEEHLRRAQKMEAIGQLAGGVAHDFNNLLMVIRGHVELLLNRPGVDAGAAHNAEAIQKASDRAAGITQQLLAFSRKQVLQARVIEMRTVVKDIANRSLREIGAEIDRLARAAREQKLAIHELQGGTFTITSLGKDGGLHATPIIHHPEVAILGVHRIQQLPVVNEGRIEIGERMNLSCSFDHRVIDGHIAAAFLYEVIRALEAPELLLADR